MPNVQDRDALYYPYIHIRDVKWLKATLLCFPQVRRIVPREFHVNDSEEVRTFLGVEGARGKPLLAEEYTDWSEFCLKATGPGGGPPYEPRGGPVYHAQSRLVTVLEENQEWIKSTYSMDAAKRDLGDKYEAFQMHAGKMLVPLHDYLMENGLVWDVSKDGDHRWLTLHPVLGEAIMSIIAIAIAQEKKLDIVTSSGKVHHALAVQDENEVLDLLLNQRFTRTEASVTEKVDELAEVMMTTYFDLDRLDAKKIAELIKEGKDLRAFKNLLVPFAEEVPDLPDPSEREKRMQAKALEVIDLWEAYKKSLPKFALDALMTGAGAGMPAIATKALALGPHVTIVASGGLFVYLVYKSVRAWQDYRKNRGSPLAFLSQIEKAGATLTLPPRASRHVRTSSSPLSLLRKHL